METRRVECPGNDALAAFLVLKREEYFQKAYSDNLDSVFIGAHRSVCESRIPLYSLREVSKLKGIGKWLLKILAEFYKGDEDEAQPNGSQDAQPNGTRAPRRYLPKKNSAPYAILITLYRALQEGREFMMRQDLIDAAEASGLANMPIGRPNKGVVPPRYGGGPQYAYSGWNSMKTLTEKCLVVKKSNPAKYMLTDEGKTTARECLERSGLGSGEDASQPSLLEENPQVYVRQPTGREETLPASKRPANFKTLQPCTNGGPDRTTNLDINKLKSMGFKTQAIQAAVKKAIEVGVLDSDMWGCVFGILVGGGSSDRAKDKGPASVVSQPAVVSKDRGFLQEGSSSERGKEKEPSFSSTQPAFPFSAKGGIATANGTWYRSAPPALVESTLPSSNTGPTFYTTSRNQECEARPSGGNELAVPPLEVGQMFEQAYDVVLILDAREQFRRDARGSGSLQKFADRMGIQFQVEVETRQLPVGDALWIARHKQQRQEYVLDFIVERKRVDDLWSSIRDTRYKQQKLRLTRCGVKRLVYLVEGDPNLTDVAENLKTAKGEDLEQSIILNRGSAGFKWTLLPWCAECWIFTTEILEGFDVQRTRDANETIQKYGDFTHAIIDRYAKEVGKPGGPVTPACNTFLEFVEHCKEIEMERVTDVFGVQLMQVRNVTEDMALSILERYPTLLSLVNAYIELEGNVMAQEQLLKDIPIRNKNKTISGNISKSVYKLVWAP